MSLIRWQKSEPNVWALPHFETLHDEINRVFGAHRSLQSEPPAVDYYEDRDQLILKAELPAMTREEIDITVDNGTRTIRGEKKFSSEVKEQTFSRIERRSGTFRRKVSLPHTVDTPNDDPD